MANTQRGNHKVVSIRFDLDNPDERTLFNWLKQQQGVSQTCKISLAHLRREIGDHDWAISIGDHLQLPKDKHSKGSAISTNQPSVNTSNFQSETGQSSTPTPDITKVKSFGLDDSSTMGSSQSKAPINDDEVDDSPFGNGGLSTPLGASSSTDDADGGDWRSKL